MQTHPRSRQENPVCNRSHSHARITMTSLFAYYVSKQHGSVLAPVRDVAARHYALQMRRSAGDWKMKARIGTPKSRNSRERYLLELLLCCCDLELGAAGGLLWIVSRYTRCRKLSTRQNEMCLASCIGYLEAMAVHRP